MITAALLDKTNRDHIFGIELYTVAIDGEVRNKFAFGCVKLFPGAPCFHFDTIEEYMFNVKIEIYDNVDGWELSSVKLKIKLRMIETLNVP